MVNVKKSLRTAWWLFRWISFQNIWTDSKQLKNLKAVDLILDCATKHEYLLLCYPPNLGTHYIKHFFHCFYSNCWGYQVEPHLSRDLLSEKRYFASMPFFYAYHQHQLVRYTSISQRSARPSFARLLCWESSLPIGKKNSLADTLFLQNWIQSTLGFATFLRHGVRGR